MSWGYTTNRSWHRRATGGLPILSAALLSAAGLMCDGALSSATAQANAGASNEVIVNYDVLNTLPARQAPAGAPPITLKRPVVAQSAEPTVKANGSQIATATPPAGPVEMPTSVPMPEPTPPPPPPASAAAPAPIAPAATAPAAAAVETPAPSAEPAPAAQAAATAPEAPALEQPDQPQVSPLTNQLQAVQETPPAEVQPVPQAAQGEPATETPPAEEQPAQQQAATQEQPAVTPVPEQPAPEPSAQEQAAQQQPAETPPEETPAPTEPPAEGQAPAETEQQPADTAAEPAAEPDNNQPAGPVPQGGIRIVFPTEMNEVPPEANAALDDLASQMQADESMRIQIKCYASGTVDTESKARRRALARCINIRQYLYQKNIRTTRMDVRALGLKSEGQPADRVDIVPANS